MTNPGLYTIHGALAALFVTIACVAMPPAAAGTATPPSLRHFGIASTESVATWTAPAVDVPRLLEEDARDRLRPGVARRVGLPMKTDLEPATSGSWEQLPGGARLWRLRLRSPGALWTVLGFETFRLEPGARLYAHDPARLQMLGPFGSEDVRRHGQLWLPPIEGDTVLIELEWPAALAGLAPELRVGTISHGYKSWGGSGDAAAGPTPDDPSTSAAGACNVDVNCPAGDDWQDEKRGVVQLLSSGSAFCTGSLVNTTANDCRPYVLTAAHCNAGPSTTFRFLYERPGCENGSVASDLTLTGATVLANYTGSDFALLEMDDDPPIEFAPFFNGWRRLESALQAWTIHHPSNDVKKISRNDDVLASGLYWGPTHWRVQDWEVGTTEGGSSGAPLFDGEGNILGQLHGGTASCANDGWDEFGKLSASWNGGGTPSTRLRDWLDPLGTGAASLEGRDGLACQPAAPELRYAGHVIDDAQGNGNGSLEPGETVSLRVSLANQGTLGADQVGGTLTSIPPLIGVANGSATWPSIDVGHEELSDLPPFSLSIDSDWICGEPVEVALQVSAAGGGAPWSLPLLLVTGTSSEVQLASEDVEGSLESWTVELPSGSNPWMPSTPNAPDLRSIRLLQSGRGTRAFLGHAVHTDTSWFVHDLPQPSESLLVLRTLGELPANARLRFRHSVNTEAGYDGGVLEYSLSGGGWIDAGDLIVEGGYNGTIDLSQATPLGGRQAWTGDLGGWEPVVVDLSSLAGEDVSLRWRFASDLSVGDEGWYVDDVEITATAWQCEPTVQPPLGEPPAVGGLPGLTQGPAELRRGTR